MALALPLALMGCSQMPSPREMPPPQKLVVLSFLNTYLPPQSDQTFAHLSTASHDFEHVVRGAHIRGAEVYAVGDGIASNEGLIQAIAEHDSPDSLTLAYIASHGTPEGLVLKDSVSFEELFLKLKAGTRGTILVVLDSCYSGLFAEALARHRSGRIFAITGTRGSSLERWYSKTGSFSLAVSKTIGSRCSPDRNGKLTLGQFYDIVAADIHSWNAANAHSAGPITEPDLYGPRELVVFDFKSN